MCGAFRTRFTRSFPSSNNLSRWNEDPVVFHDPARKDVALEWTRNQSPRERLLPSSLIKSPRDRSGLELGAVRSPSPLELELLALCREALATPNLRLDEDFISDVGADSVRIARLAVVLHNVGGVVPSNDVMQSEQVPAQQRAGQPLRCIRPVHVADLLTTARTVQSLAAQHFSTEERARKQQSNCSTGTSKTLSRGKNAVDVFAPPTSSSDSTTPSASPPTKTPPKDQQVEGGSTSSNIKGPAVLSPLAFTCWQTVLVSVTLVPLLIAVIAIRFLVGGQCPGLFQQSAGEVLSSICCNKVKVC